MPLQVEVTMFYIQNFAFYSLNATFLFWKVNLLVPNLKSKQRTKKSYVSLPILIIKTHWGQILCIPCKISIIFFYAYLTAPSRALQPKDTKKNPKIGLFVIQVFSLGSCRRPIQFLTSSHPFCQIS